MAEIDWGEARRYLGLHRPGGAWDGAMEDRLRDCGQALAAAVEPRGVWRRFPLELGKDAVAVAGMDIESSGLRRHLEGCGEAYLFAATLGVEADRLIHRAGVTDVSRAVLLQACAASLLEAYCDECCGAMTDEVRGAGLFLKPRFSPGYGDFPLAHQRGLLAALDGGKRIGLSVTGGLMLAPTKSVTAVVGLSGTPWCGIKGCGACGKTDCGFRR